MVVKLELAMSRQAAVLVALPLQGSHLVDWELPVLEDLVVDLELSAWS